MFSHSLPVWRTRRFARADAECPAVLMRRCFSAAANLAIGVGGIASANRGYGIRFSIIFSMFSDRYH